MSTPPPGRLRLARRLAVALVLLFLLLATGAYLARPVLEGWIVKQIEAALDDALVPDVRIDGPVRWQLWPQPWVSLDGVSITDGGMALVRNERLLVELDAEALRSRLLVLERVVLDRPEIMLGDHPARWMSADAWLVPGPGASRQAPPVVRHFVVRDGRLSVDRPIPVHLASVAIELELPMDEARPGRLAIDAEFRATVQGVPIAGRISQLGEIEVEQAGVVLREASVHLEGNALGFEAIDMVLKLAEVVAAEHETSARDLDLALQVQANSQSLHLTFSLAELALVKDALMASGLSGEISFDDESNRGAGAFSIRKMLATANAVKAELALALTLTGPLDIAAGFDGVVDYATDDGQADHVRGQGRLGLRLPPRKAGAEPIELDLETLTDWWPRLARAQGEVTGQLDGSELAGRWRFDPQVSRPLHVKLAIDRLDLDDYLAESLTDGPPDLAPWRSWPLSAEVLIGRFRWRGLETTDARLAINPD